MLGISLVLVGLVVVVAIGAFLFTISAKSRSNIPHPAELTSTSRSALRPLRQAAESFEAILKANPDAEATKIIGTQAKESVQKTVAEASKLATTRDQLSEIIRRAQMQGTDSTAAQDQLNKLDQQIASATASIDALSLRITQNISSQAATIPSIEADSDLPDLISRLENISQSFDEVHQSATIEQSQ